MQTPPGEREARIFIFNNLVETRKTCLFQKIMCVFQRTKKKELGMSEENEKKKIWGGNCVPVHTFDLGGGRTSGNPQGEIVGLT